MADLSLDDYIRFSSQQSYPNRNKVRLKRGNEVITANRKQVSSFSKNASSNLQATKKTTGLSGKVQPLDARLKLTVKNPATNLKRQRDARQTIQNQKRGFVSGGSMARAMPDARATIQRKVTTKQLSRLGGIGTKVTVTNTRNTAASRLFQAARTPASSSQAQRRKLVRWKSAVSGNSLAAQSAKKPKGQVVVTDFGRILASGSTGSEVVLANGGRRLMKVINQSSTTVTTVKNNTGTLNRTVQSTNVISSAVPNRLQRNAMADLERPNITKVVQNFQSNVSGDGDSSTFVRKALSAPLRITMKNDHVKLTAPPDIFGQLPADEDDDYSPQLRDDIVSTITPPRVSRSNPKAPLSPLKSLSSMRRQGISNSRAVANTNVVAMRYPETTATANYDDDDEEIYVVENIAECGDFEESPRETKSVRSLGTRGLQRSVDNERAWRVEPAEEEDMELETAQSGAAGRRAVSENVNVPKVRPLNLTLLSSALAAASRMKAPQQQARERGPEVERYQEEQLEQEEDEGPSTSSGRWKLMQNVVRQPRKEQVEAAREKLDQSKPSGSSGALTPIKLTKRSDFPATVEAGENVISPLQGFRVLVTNLCSSVTYEDIVELFGAMGQIKWARMLKAGTAEVVFNSRDNALNAIRKYNNRELDGNPMCVQLTTAGNHTPSSADSSQPVGLPKYLQASPGSTAQPLKPLLSPQQYLTLIHKALFKTVSKDDVPTSPVTFTVKI